MVCHNSPFHFYKMWRFIQMDEALRTYSKKDTIRPILQVEMESKNGYTGL